MQSNQKRGPLLKHLDELERICSEGPVSLARISEVFGKEGHYLLIFFFILPFLQPIPLLGLSTPFGLIIAAVTYFAAMGKPPMIPAKWASKELPGSTVLKIAESSEKVVEKLSSFIHPRLSFLFMRPYKNLNSGILIVNAILLALPLPIPFSNAMPAWAVLFQALAHLEEDGALIILSYIQTLVCVIYFVALGLGANFLLSFF